MPLVPIPPSESRRLLASIIISLIRKHLAELSLTLTRLRHFRSASILDRVDRCFHVCNPSTQYLRVFVPSIMEHRRACREARRLASTLFFSQFEWGPTLDGVILENEPRKIPTFRYCRQLSAQGSVSHTTCLRLTSFSVFSVDTIQLALKTTSYEFSFLPSYTGSGHHMEIMLLSLHTRDHPRHEPVQRAMCHCKHAPRKFPRAAMYGALWQNIGPDHPRSLGLQNYKNPLTSQ